MFADADHEVIDSPEALFRHLYEEHGVEEARDLDPDTAPVQFWLRRHADLERAERAARRQPDPPPEPVREPEPAPRRTEGRGQAPFPPSAGRGPARPEGGNGAREGRRHVGFGDPLLEAVTRALVGRGHAEAAVRSAIRSFPAAGGQPPGEAGVRGAFVEPMLAAVAEHLLAPGGPRRPPRPEPAPAAATRPGPAPATPPPAPAAAGPAPPPAREEPARPEAAWAVLWADLADTGRRGGQGPGPAGDDGDDLMAVADAVQARRRVRLLRR
jgi:hypothetical protein